MAKRVFELARELGVTSKVVLEKCRAEGLEIKNHMSALTAGQQATVREWFTEGAGGTAVELAEHVDLDKARADARKRRRKRRKGEPEEAPVAVAEAPAEGEAVAVVGEAPAEEVPVGEAPVAAAEAAEPAEVVAEAPAAAEAAAAPVVEAPEEPSAEEVPAPAVTEAVPVAEAPAGEEAGEVVAGEAPAPAEAPEEQAEAEEPEAEPEKSVIKPAGPQVVPKPAVLKGPRIVRVEKPDVIQQPRRPRRPLIPMGTGPSVVAGPVPSQRGRGGVKVGAESDRRKKTKRRSPRRRGGRSAESGEGLRQWREQDLQERSARLAAAGGGLRRHRPSVSRRPAGGKPIARGGQVEIEEPITVKGLSAAAGLKASDIIKKLMLDGVMVTINQVIDRELAETVAAGFDIELVVKAAKSAEDELVAKLESREKAEALPRPPVVTFLGHVDHGKTSLLDYIRKTSVASGEAGGITQHTGAYRLDRDDTHAVFLDTPGHEAFTAMRARGANMTDVVVLVVAADDGVMPQTQEAISHARAAKVPVVVALNKIDLPNANVQRALGQLAEAGLQPQEWGGNVEVIQTSAVTGEGVDKLLETLTLEAELLELRAETDAPASGYVIEAEMDPGLGVLCRLLVLNGTLRVGDTVLAGQGWGRVRQLQDWQDRVIEEVGPGSPVVVSGLDELPEAGDRFYVTDDPDGARAVAEDRRQQARARALAAAATAPRSLDDLFNQIQAGEAHELALIIKADVQGSVEALVDSLKGLGTDEVRTNILHAAVGGITTGDVALAEASSALIIGFNVVPNASARQEADAKGVEVRLYRVIYDVIEDVRRALEEGLAPEVREESLGRAEVRQVFRISRVGTVAGCYVTDGLVSRNAKVRIIRDNVVIEDDRTLDSLRRFKDDVREVRAGMECGLKVAGYDDIKEGDALEFYQRVEVARTL